MLYFFGFGIGYTECFRRNFFHFLCFDGTIAVVGRSSGDFVNRIHALNNFPESGILSVEIACVRMRSEERRVGKECYS